MYVCRYACTYVYVCEAPAKVFNRLFMIVALRDARFDKGLQVCSKHPEDSICRVLGSSSA